MKKNAKRKRTTREKQAQQQKRKKNILIAFMCVVLICVGYIGADAFMLRHSHAVTGGGSSSQSAESGEEKTAKVTYISLGVPSVALDNSVMLDSVMSDAEKGGFYGVAFELKRADGTIGYASALTTVDTFGGISTPAKQLHDSLKTLTSRNLQPIARICCLKDNVVPKRSPEMALLRDEKPYTDEKGNTYLNPDSEDAMKYLREIVSESYNLGVRVFVLSSTDLPAGIKEGHNDGFKTIVQKIRGDASDALFLEEVGATINGWNIADGEYNDAGFKQEIEKLPALEENQIYVIKTEKDIDDVNEKLKDNNVSGYILVED